MSSRKIKHLKLTSALTDTLRGGDAEAEKDEKALQQVRRPWYDLPPELLELIASKGLPPYDKIEASRVCKTWHSAMRVVNRFPWIFYYPRRRSDPHISKLFDPTKPKTYSIDIPEELRGATLRYAKDGWLLYFRSQGTRCLFFFNPFTREIIKLPDIECSPQSYAFSCAPTSPRCVVFLSKDNYEPNGSIKIHTWHPGATAWTTSIHTGCHWYSYDRQDWSKIVVCNGLFYRLCFCISLLGIFDPQGRKWTQFEFTPPSCWRPRISSSLPCWWKGTFVAEHRGEILAVHACGGENPRLLKMHQRKEKVEWNEVSSLDGASFFAGFRTSQVKNRIDLLPGNIKSRIYLPKTSFAGKQKRFLSYSIDEGRYHPFEMFDEKWGKPHLLNSLWIEPPQELPSFFFR